jgi:hypothetical protein
LRRRISTASGSERLLARATLATARGTDPVDALQNDLVSKGFIDYDCNLTVEVLPKENRPVQLA